MRGIFAFVSVDFGEWVVGLMVFVVIIVGGLFDVYMELSGVYSMVTL